MNNFDVDGARKAGYTDTEIADKLASVSQFDSAGARAAGFKDSDIIARLTAPTPVQASTSPATQVKTDDPGIMGSMVIGAGRTFDRVGKGMQQLYYGATGNDAASADLKQRAAEDDRLYKPLQEQHPIATAVGESVPSMAVPVGGASATVLGAAGKLAASSAIPAALEYGSAEERMKNAAGAATGAVVGGVVAPKVAGAAWQGVKNGVRGLAGNITPEALALAAKAKTLGIEVNAAQLGDSKFLKTLASSVEQMPFTGGSQANARQRAEFTRAVSKTFGANDTKITPDVYLANRDRLGKNFDALAAQNTLQLDRPLTVRLQNTLDEATQMADEGTAKSIKAVIDRLTGQSRAVNNTGGLEVPGQAYSSMDSMLSKQIKAGGEKSVYLKEVQEALRDAMDRSISPADKKLWDETRGQYRNLKAVRDIVAKGAGDGDVPPMQLLNALNNSEAGKEAMAKGSRGNIGDLGRIGRQFVRDAVPNSGTAQRAMAMGLIGGGGYAFGADPATIAGMLVGGATAGRTVNALLHSPKVIAELGKKGMTVTEVLRMPPSKAAQILGGITGQAVIEDSKD